MIEKIIPNEFEFRILCFQDGYIPSSLLIKIFLDTEVYLPSASDKENSASLICPDIVGEKRITIFTSINLLFFAAMTLRYFKFVELKSYYKLTGLEVLQRLPKKHGLSINPGFNTGFTISEKEVLRILKNLKKYDELL